MQQKIQELRKIIAGSTRVGSYIGLLESLILDVSDITNPIEPVDSIEIRQAIRKYLQNELDVIRHITNTKRGEGASVRRDDT